MKYKASQTAGPLLMNFNRVGDVDRGAGAQALDRLLNCTAHAAVELMHRTGYKVYAF